MWTLESVKVYTVKILVIFVSTIYYFIACSIFSILLNRIIPNAEISSLSNVALFAYISTIFGIISIGFYIIRRFVKRIPFPFDGISGYEHSKLKEASGGIIVGFMIFNFQDRLSDYVSEYKRRFA